MTWEQILSLVGIGVSLAVGAGTIINHWRANRTTQDKVQSEIKHSVVDDYLALDRRVAELVDEKVTPLRDEIARMNLREQTRTQAFVRIFRRIWEQWPHGHPGPLLDPEDIKAVEDTLPPQWVREGEAPKQS